FSLLSLCFTQEPLQKNPLVEKIISQISPSNIRASIEKLASFETRHTLSDTTISSKGIGAARRWIKSEFERYSRLSKGRMQVGYQEFTSEPSTRVPHPTRVVNVIATLKPTDSNSSTSSRIFIVSGHYDSRATNVLDSISAAPGANDDGSGTALVLELARVMSEYEFNATIMFIAFAGEEQGLLGSTYCAEIARQQGWTIKGVFNNDIVGNIRGGTGEVESTYVRLFSEAYSPRDTGVIFRQRNSLGYENDGASRSLARYIKEIGEKYFHHFGVKLIYRRDRFLRGGDHLPFHERGFAAVRFTEAKENFDRQHQNIRTEGGRSFGDLPDDVDFEYCANITRINAAALASLAFAPPEPEGVEIVTKNLDYSTEIHWRPVVHPTVAGYLVRYRETTSPTWQNAVFTPDTMIANLPSKDDFIFGIQAVDKDGNCSLVSLPRPSR
ncbi:MAG: M28 family peptidase, partial [Ignavibacteria bacterium]|nr:M28 family peptidase [Ignavibacteria bacterium]